MNCICDRIFDPFEVNKYTNDIIDDTIDIGLMGSICGSAWISFREEGSKLIFNIAGVTSEGDEIFDKTMDVKINFCPFCGKKFDHIPIAVKIR